MANCTDCSMTQSAESKDWPEGVVSVKMTMNPYLLAMAMEESLKSGMKYWELVNVALWEKLGKPDKQKLMEFAASMETFDEDPKWKKRLKLAATFENAVEREKQMGQAAEGPGFEA